MSPSVYTRDTSGTTQRVHVNAHWRPSRAPQVSLAMLRERPPARTPD